MDISCIRNDEGRPRARLDCVGLFFFIIPGVAALAVDFSSGAIYLPNKKTARLDVIRFDKERGQDPSYLDSLISKHARKHVSLTGESVKWIRTEQKSEESIEKILKHLNSDTDDNVAQDQYEGSLQNS